MFLVISKWEAKPGQEDLFITIGREMRSVVRSWPGVQFIHSIRGEDGNAVVIVAYDDLATYEDLMANRFEALAEQYGIENIAIWRWSERGVSMDEASA